MATKYPSIKQASLIILVALIIVGFIFRLYALDYQSYWIDEGYTVAISQAIADHGYPLLDSGLIWYKKNILHNYLTALPVAIFGANPWSVRIISVIFGAASIYLLYLLAKKLFKKESIALLSAGFLALSHWAIVWSRQGRSYAIFQFLYLLSIYLLADLLEKFNLKRFSGFIIISLLAIAAHDSGIIILPCGLALLSWRYKQDIKNYFLKKSWKNYWWLGLIIIPAAWLIIAKTIAFVNLFNTRIFIVADNYLRWLWHDYNFLLLGSLIGLIYLLKKPSERQSGLIFLFFYGLALALTISITDFLELRYIFFIFPLMILLAVYIIITAASIFKHKIIAYIIAVLMIIIANWSNLEFYPQKYYQLDLYVPNPNFNGAYAAIKQQWQTNDIIISPYIPLDMAYLGRSDYFLMMSFSGKPQELASYQYNPYDLYYKKPLIKNIEELNNIISQHHGFVIFDQLAYNRLGERYFSLLNSQGQQIFHEENGWLNNIWVFKF